MKVTQIGFRLVGIVSLVTLFASVTPAQEFSFQVKHDHTVGHCEGKLLILADRVEFQSANKKHSRVWSYRDIKLVEIEPATRLRILTYEDRGLLLGADRRFSFELLGGELNPRISAFLRDRTNRPLVTAVFEHQEGAEAQIAVKHLHRFGGCSGTLEVYKDHLAFIATPGADSRLWRWSDIRGISRLGRFRLEVLTYEPELGGPDRSYNFELKEPLSEEEFNILWGRVYRATPICKSDRREGR